MTSTTGSRYRKWRTAVVLATTVTVCGGITSALPTIASAAVIDTNASYVLINRNSGKALDVYERATADGARISQYTRNDGAWQQWQFVDSGGGYYRLKSRHSGKVLDFPATADRTGLVQTTDAGRTSQQFRPADSPDGYVRLINRASGKAADVLDFSAADGAQVIQWPDTGGTNQQWLLAKVGAGTFTNPIKRSGPDPWLQYHNGYYYLATTTWNSTITMRRSRTLAGLSTAPDTTVFNLSGRPNGCCNMWAPEFHLLNGRWYLYYVAGQNVPDYNPTQRLHVLESAGTDPMGPYTFKADLGTTWELDPSILQHNGKLYLMGSGIDGTQSLTITPLSNPYTISGARRTISQPTLAWERQTGAGQRGSRTAVPQRPHHDRVLGQRVLGPGLQARPAHPDGQRPARPRRTGPSRRTPCSSARRQQRLRAGPQRVLQVARRHRGLDRLPRQRLASRASCDMQPLHPRPEVHLELRRHTELRHPGPARHHPGRTVR